MISICGWHKKYFSGKPIPVLSNDNLDDWKISHGMCKACSELANAELEAYKKPSELASVFINRDDMSRAEAESLVNEMKEEVVSGADPESVLLDQGLELDYIFDII